MYRPVHAIEVRIWNRRAGAVAFDPVLGCHAFEYDPAFATSGIEIAPLTMPLAGSREPFAFPALSRSTYLGLPAAIADALPDDFGNALIDAWLAKEGIQKANVSALDRLAYMGKRAMGALEFKPAHALPKAPSAIAMSDLVEGARRAVRGELADDTLAETALAQIIQVGTSAGGARAKAAIAWNPTSNQIRAGQFDVDPGFEHWLLKLDGIGADKELGPGDHYGRIEYAYYLMALAAGITMMPSRLLEENGRAHFMTRRFDREDNSKIHVQSLCGMAELDFRQKATHDVSQWLQTIERLELGYPALEEAFRRIAFNVMAANCDDHTKNVSFLMHESGGWMLAPAYDLTHAHNPKGEWTYQHLMSVNGKFTDITRADLLKVAADFGIGTAPAVLAKVRQAVKAWPASAAKAGLSKTEIHRVVTDHRLV
jgi:serine/threonine-protein kinase HipA